MRVRAWLWIAVAGLAAAAALPLSACGGGSPTELVVLTHDSFDVNKDLLAGFEREHDAKVTILKGGDANAMVNRAVLSAGKPEADVLFGVDNLSYQRALAAGVFAPYRAVRRGEVAAELRSQFGDAAELTPVDYGFVALNFDKKAGAPPKSFDELADAKWRGKLVVEDPATSSPGLQFLASTVAHFGEGKWQAFWRALRANDVRVADGWETAYYRDFSPNGGDRPLVVSYTTSPAAEVFFAKQPISEPPTVNVIPGPLFRQVEAVGVLKGARHEALARAFVDFMLSDRFQAQIPETMFVYPVIAGLSTPEWWKWAQVDVKPATIAASQPEIERWISEWTSIMKR
ncbi:MAG: thiamine ABC transporter substrate-binding protein [Dehalococcoidia bacterium]|nr:thiamine ABC transporter substrate-binding protein [Dehalococcoidia bacterium]